MSSQEFRHRNTEKKRLASDHAGACPRTDAEGLAPEVRPEEQRARPQHETAKTSTPRTAAARPEAPCLLPPATPLFPEARELGRLNALFRMAESRTHPDPESAEQRLRARVLEAVTGENRPGIPLRTTLRDRVSSTDSRLKPALGAAAVVLILALLAAGTYAVMHWLQPVATEPAAVAGFAKVFFPGF